MEKRFEYIKADRFSLKNIPKEYIPTERAFYFMGIFLVIGVIIGLFSFPIGKMMKGDTNFSMDFGYPMTMLSLSLENPEQFPIKIWGSIVNLILCLILGTATDLTVNILSKRFEEMTSEERKFAPKVYKKIIKIN